MSEIARARAFWLNKPYALLRSGDKGMGPDCVCLIRGRPETAVEGQSWPFPVGICGIVEQDALVGQIDGFASGDRYLVMTTTNQQQQRVENKDQVAVIDLSDPAAEVMWFPTVQQAMHACAEDPALRGQVTWKTFEGALHREELGQIATQYAPLIIAILVLITMLIWFRLSAAETARSRRRTKFLCLYSAFVAAWAIVSALLLPELCTWLFAVFSAAIGLATLGQLKKAHGSLPPAYRWTAVASACLGCFAAIILPLLLLVLLVLQRR